MNRRTMARWASAVAAGVLAASCGGGGGGQRPIGSIGGMCDHNGAITVTADGRWECRWLTVPGKSLQEKHWILVSR